MEFAKRRQFAVELRNINTAGLRFSEDGQCDAMPSNFEDGSDFLSKFLGQ